MSLDEAARAANEKADRSIDRGDHAVASAMQAAIDAELWTQDRSLDPPAPEDNPPPAPQVQSIRLPIPPPLDKG